MTEGPQTARRRAAAAIQRANLYSVGEDLPCLHGWAFSGMLRAVIA